MLLGGWIQEFLAPVVGEEVHTEPPIPALAITGLAVLVVAVGVTIAILFVGRRDVPRVAPQDVSFVTRAARNDIYGDAINDELVVKPGKRLTAGLVTFDRTVVDGLFSGGARQRGGCRSPAQTGPERLRPLLRALDHGRRAPRRPRPSGGEPRMTTPRNRVAPPLRSSAPRFRGGPGKA